MSSNKTRPNNQNVDQFIASIDDKQQRVDSNILIDLFNNITDKPAVMWGDAIVGFGQATLKYASGREVEWPVVAFSPRKGKLVLYVTFDAVKLTAQFPDLGTYKITKGCIYLKSLADVDMRELERLIKVAYEAGWQSPERRDGKEQVVEMNGDK